MTGAPLSAEAFTSLLREEGARRYHDMHPFHVRMNDGHLSAAELRSWVTNRYYYQTRIPIKDALILAKSDEPEFRRAWRRRLADHDGDDFDPGGIARWEALAEACGTPRETLRSHAAVAPGARAACDAYVDFVREAPLVEAVASSLTECFAPDLMRARIAAWEKHYPWVATSGLAYFRERVPRASRDGAEALRFVVARATSRREQEACVAALVKKTEILWRLLDAIQAEGEPRCGEVSAKLSRGVRLVRDRTRGVTLLLAPDRGLSLSATTAAILELCDGARDVDTIARLLSKRFTAPAERIGRDVRAALRRLVESGYLRWSDK